MILEGIMFLLTSTSIYYFYNYNALKKFIINNYTDDENALLDDDNESDRRPYIPMTCNRNRLILY